MSKRTIDLVLSSMLAVLLAPQPARAEREVNVNWQYCGGTCSEGHNDTECLCEARAGEHPFGGGPEKYWDCYEVRCCDIVWQSYEESCYGYPYSDCYTPSGGSCVPDDTGWCVATVWYAAEVDHIEVVGRAPGSNATFANETGFWYHSCTLWGQSPWDDGGHYGIIWD